ncbi:MAG: hypothetical protein ABJC51_03325, partial [Acidobacteriota bacterium]
WPLDQSRLPLGLRRMADEPDGPARLQRAITDVLVRYNARRATGAITGPELQAIRLYKISWTLEPFAANLDLPTTRVLMAESPGPDTRTGRLQQ